MNRFHAIDHEVAKLDAAATAGYFLALRVRGASPLMVYKTFPEAWLETYMENGYMLRDPVTTWALTIGGTIRWSSRFLPDPFGVLRQAAEHGLKYGASIAHGPVSSLTICSIARSDRELTDAEIATARDVVLRLHDLTELPKALTAEEKTLLKALSSDARPQKVAEQLEVSQPVARSRIEQICEALLCSTPEDAVQRAREHKLM